MIKEIEAKKVLTYHEQAFPTHWDVNPYRGCTVGCKYCFAQYSHKYLRLDDFFKDIIVKTNVAECLEKELSNKKWKGQQIKIGGTTDLYQHSEKSYELMQKLLEVIKRHRNPVFIQTKSTLLLRDYELIKELAKITTVDIATRISTFDNNIQKIIEPGAASAMERLEMLAQFGGIVRSSTLGLMPIIPLLSDTDENLETTFREAKKMGIDNIVTSILFLRGEVKPSFFKVIQKHFPEKFLAFAALYTKSDADENYRTELFKKLRELRAQYNFHKTFVPAPAKKETEQLTLF